MLCVVPCQWPSRPCSLCGFRLRVDGESSGHILLLGESQEIPILPPAHGAMADLAVTLQAHKGLIVAGIDGAVVQPIGVLEPSVAIALKVGSAQRGHAASSLPQLDVRPPPHCPGAGKSGPRWRIRTRPPGIVFNRSSDQCFDLPRHLPLACCRPPFEVAAGTAPRQTTPKAVLLS